MRLPTMFKKLLAWVFALPSGLFTVIKIVDWIFGLPDYIENFAFWKTTVEPYLQNWKIGDAIIIAIFGISLIVLFTDGTPKNRKSKTTKKFGKQRPDVLGMDQLRAFLKCKEGENEDEALLKILRLAAGRLEIGVWGQCCDPLSYDFDLIDADEFKTTHFEVSGLKGSIILKKNEGWPPIASGGAALEYFIEPAIKWVNIGFNRKGLQTFLNKKEPFTI